MKTIRWKSVIVVWKREDRPPVGGRIHGAGVNRRIRSLLPLIFGACVILSGGRLAVARGQNDEGVRYLENVIHKFDGINDYSVDVKVHMNMKAVQAPDMEATVYFKKPDKIKIDSKGLFFLPRDVGVMNPQKFDPNKYIVDVVDTLTYNGDPAAKLSLVPRDNAARGRNVLLTIDTKKWLIVEVSTAPYPGREAGAKIKYGIFGGFEMPVEIDARFDAGKSKGGAADVRAEHGRMDQLNGTVEIYYSNYKINSGLPDKLFEKKNEEY